MNYDIKVYNELNTVSISLIQFITEMTKDYLCTTSIENIYNNWCSSENIHIFHTELVIEIYKMIERIKYKAPDTGTLKIMLKEREQLC